MDTATLRAEFAALEPWIFRFKIGDGEYGGYVSAIGDVRVQHFHDFAPEAKTILELGALEGAHTFMLAEHASAERVVAVEGRAANLRKARFLQRLLAVENVEFVQADLETDPLAFGAFDVVFCSALVSHLPRPWELIARLPALAPKLFLWTVYSDDASADVVIDGFRGRHVAEGGPDEPLSGLSAQSLWLTLGSLLDALTRAGYGRIDIIHNDLAHPAGRAVTLGATVAK